MKDGYIKKIREKIGHDTLIFCGASVIVHKDSKVLLQKRKDNGLWGLHGGCVEVYEKVEEGAKRELLEETGLIANKLNFFTYKSGKDMYYKYPNGDKSYIINMVFTCDDFGGELLAESDEAETLQWFDVFKLPPKLHRLDKRVIDSFQKHQNKNKDIKIVIYGLEYAMLNGGVKEPETLLARDFSWVGTNGTVYEKCDMMEYVKKRAEHCMKISDFTAQMLGDGQVLVTYKGQRNTKHYICSSVWLFEGESWRMTFHQSTRVTDS